MAILVCQYHICPKLTDFLFLRCKVHKTHCIYWQELISPFIFLLAFVHLLYNATTGITNGTVQEVWLPSVLHLQYESLASVGFAIHIIDDTSLILCWGQLLLVHESNVLHTKFAFQEIIQETYQQILAEFLTKETFKPPVCKRVDVLCHSPFH